MKKFFRIAVAALFSLSLLGTAACGPSDGPEIDETKAQLYVGNFDGGFGSDWINTVAARFEEKYQNTVFWEGTQGVQVIVEGSKTSGKTLIDTIATQKQDVFFTEQGFYYDGASQGKFLDITDIVKEDLTEKYGEEGSIYDKLNETQKDYYDYNGKIYAIPHYASYFGLSYDIDLFEKQNLYYAKNPTTSTGLVTSKTQERSLGPDGKTGIIDGVDYSADDGLPATYDELFALCDVMTKKGITPFLWSGMVRQGYIDYFLGALYADYEGEKNMMLNYNFNGTSKDLVSSLSTDSSGKITDISFRDETPISKRNGYELINQAGRAYALSFVDRMTSNVSYFHDDAKNESVSHTGAQLTYLESSLINKPVAFFIDGSYWENEAEASGAFDQLVGEYGARAARENRRFGYMPLPKAETGMAGGATLYDYLYSLAFINANIADKSVEMAKLFLQFCYTDESLVEFTAITNTPRALNYDIPQDVLEEMSAYGKSVFALKNNPNTSIVYPYSTDPMYLNNQSSFNLLSQWTSVVNGTAKSYAIDAFRKDGINAKDYFLGMATVHSKTVWDNTYSKYFD